jgi:hypothetical protein
MKSTIELASGATVTKTGHFVFTLTELKTFEALVRADERERIADESKHIIKRAEARGAAVEREACAKVCENWTQTPETTGMELALCAAAIRARGETK